MQTYGTQSQRIGRIKGEILAHAVHKEVLGITGQNKKMPKNAGDTIVYARFLPYGAANTNANTQNRPAVTAAAHILGEGVTPSADTLTRVDITVQLQEYGCLYGVTNKVVDLYEDDIPAEMKEQTGERMGLLREMIRYGALKACTNLYYAGGTSRATVDETVSINLLSKVTRNLQLNHAEMITSVLEASTKFNTTPVQAAYLVFASTDLEHDIEALPGFKHASEYGTRKVVHDCELGSVGRYRFVLSPELTGFADAGAAVGTTGLQSTSSSNIDVFPMIVTGQKAWGDVALRGASAIDPTWIPPGKKDKNDPLGQRGYIGARFYDAAKVLNDGWMAVVEVGITSL